MASTQQLIPVQLDGGVKVHVEATVLGGEEDVAFKLFSFQGVTDAIEAIATAVDAAMQKVKPKKASIEFGVEVAVESGQLTTLLVKGSGTANFKIALEWGE
jgi:hypothetical protein